MKLSTKQLERAAKALADTTGTGLYNALLIVATANINSRENEVQQWKDLQAKDREEFWKIKDEWAKTVTQQANEIRFLRENDQQNLSALTAANKAIEEYREQVAELQTALANRDKYIRELESNLNAVQERF